MNDTIRRKVLTGAATGSDGSPGADHGWRLAFARAARDATSLLVSVKSLRMTRRSLAELLELPPDRALIALLDGPAAGLGMIALSCDTTAALVEMQTIGRVAAGASVARRPTRTDAAMVTGVIDRALVELEELLAEEADLVWAGGFRYASFLEDARPLGLLLDDQAYRVLSMEIELGEDGRRGQVLLALPAEGRGQKPTGQSRVAVEAPSGSGAPTFSVALTEAVMGADVTLQAVIARITVPLRSVMGLAPDQVIPLPDAALDAISVEGIDGRALVRARLGQHRGMRALRVDTSAAAGSGGGQSGSQSGGLAGGLAATADGFDSGAAAYSAGLPALSAGGAAEEMPLFDPDAGFLAAG